MSSVNYLHGLNRPDGNYSHLFNNKQFITQLINSIKSNLGRNLQQPEKQIVITYLQNIDTTLLSKKKPDDVLKLLTTQLVNKIQKFTCSNETVDIHEMLKNEIGSLNEQDADYDMDTAGIDTDIVQYMTGKNNVVDIATIFGNKNIDSIVKKIQFITTAKTIRLLLDTRYRLLDNDGSTYYKWNYIGRTDLQQGTTNATIDIQNITAVRAFPIKVPYVSLLDNNAYSRVSMYISEFSAQSIIAQEGRNYHFLYGSKTNNRFVDLDFGNITESAYYRFRQPIARLDTLTITFGSPLQPVIFDTDRLQTYDTQYATSTILDFPQVHNLETGDLVYINNFTTISPNNDNDIIQAVNSTNGVIATYINATTISINVDTSSIQFLGPGLVDIWTNSDTVTGINTTFTSTFKVNDVISLLGVLYLITNIIDDNYLNITPNYQGGIDNNIQYYKDNNDYAAKNLNVYFGSKRAFIPLEIEYL